MSKVNDASAGSSGGIFHRFNMKSTYQRRARLMPALIALLPLLPMLGPHMVTWPELPWIKVVGGAGIWVLAGALLSHASSILGNRVQRTLWPKWPYDAPTHRWLHPESKATSAQQRSLWYRDIKSITGLDLAAALKAGPTSEGLRMINDANRAVRSKLWSKPEAKRMDEFNIRYGFARNLLGWLPVATGFAVLSLVFTFGAVILARYHVGWVVGSFFALAVCILGFWVLPSYVRRQASYYAEGYFEAITRLAGKSSS